MELAENIPRRVPASQFGDGLYFIRHHEKRAIHVVNTTPLDTNIKYRL
jgi:hypothetical protein